MMEKLIVCPSALAVGFDTYSPQARKLLFDGHVVSHILPFDSPSSEGSDAEEYARHVGRISLSGVQPKGSLLLRNNSTLERPEEGERGTYILKPAPSSYSLLEKEYCPANEHL